MQILFIFFFNNVDAYIEEISGDKHLAFASTDKNKEVLKNYKTLCDETENQIETINGGESIKYKIYFIRIRFESDDDLSLGKILSIHSIIIATRFVFQEDSKYCSQVCLHECVYESVVEL